MEGGSNNSNAMFEGMHASCAVLVRLHPSWHCALWLKASQVVSLELIGGGLGLQGQEHS
jgi:hypothetical protein